MFTGLNHLTLAVTDLDRSLFFYVDLLGLKAEVRWARGAYLSRGELWLCLSQGDVDARADASHVAFGVEAADFEPFRRRLLAAGVESWRRNRSEGHSFYFLDPDGHHLEIHVGNLESRLAFLKREPYEGMERF